MASWWDVSYATNDKLEWFKNCVKLNPELNRLRGDWERRGIEIKTLEDLLRLYFGDIKIILIPHGQMPPDLIKRQYTSLYDEIKKSSGAAMTLRQRTGLLMTSKELGYYLESAFEHFSENASKPFNFLAAALRRNPIAPDFKHHVLRVAMILMTLHPLWKGEAIFVNMSHLVASCIFLDSKRNHFPQSGRAS
jgi:hypothetical protein